MTVVMKPKTRIIFRQAIMFISMEMGLVRIRTIGILKGNLAVHPLILALKLQKVPIQSVHQGHSVSMLTLQLTPRR